MEEDSFYIFHHFGLGDHILCNGLVREFKKKYEKSIVNFFSEMGYVLLKKSNVEDTIRKNENSLENILTCIFYKKHD